MMRLSGNVRLTAVAGAWLWGALACGQQAPYFDGQQAFQLLEDQVALGPRYNGSIGHLAMQGFLRAYLEPRAHDFRVQRVEQPHPYEDRTLVIHNYLARFNPELSQRVLVMAHYDTRPYADQETDPAKRNIPLLGANDGASGVAVLMVLADLLSRAAPDVGVDLLFLDAEDIGRSGDTRNFALGAQAFVAKIDSLLDGHRPRYAVLLDMVGDKALSLPIEYYSWRDAPDLARRIWNLADELGYSQFKLQTGAAIFDDHVPFLEAGIPAVNIIDFDYPDAQSAYWHTLADTPDKCSPESLAAVGTVITHLIYRERP